MLGQETGLDSTWERYVVHELPRVLPRVLPRSGSEAVSADAIASLFTNLFLRGAGG